MICDCYVVFDELIFLWYDMFRYDMLEPCMRYVIWLLWYMIWYDVCMMWIDTCKGMISYDRVYVQHEWYVIWLTCKMKNWHEIQLWHTHEGYDMIWKKMSAELYYMIIKMEKCCDIMPYCVLMHRGIPLLHNDSMDAYVYATRQENDHLCLS